MKILLRTQTAPDVPATESILDVPIVRIGRGAGQDLVLNDLRVTLEHAELHPRHGFFGDGLRVQAKVRAGVSVNGENVPGADLSSGDTLDLGRFRLTILRPEKGYDATLLLQERYASHEEQAVQQSRLKTDLAQTGWSRRRLAWMLVPTILGIFLVLPIVMHVLPREADAPEPTRERAVQTMPGLDVLWSSGPLSTAHHALQNDCSACHQTPFQKVTDQACRSCHADIKEHASTPAGLLQAPFEGIRCTDCHREHNGPHALTPLDNAACTVCHAQAQKTQQGNLEAVADWSHHHPAFTLKLARSQPAGDPHRFDWIEARQGTPEAQREDTGLKFPHDVHLSAKGVDSPTGRRVMECTECHQPASDGLSFQPIRMEPHCSQCHRLDFDKAEPGRELPHGKPEEVVRVIRDYYSRIALSGGSSDPSAPTMVQQRRRPGETLSPAGARAALEWADGKADTALRDVFERRTCFYCHDVRRDGPEQAPWQIAAVAPEKLAFTASVFPHNRHATENCSLCHAAEKSDTSTQVLLPDIHRCRDCHGDTGAMTKTPSPCQACHVYHLAAHAPKVKP